MPVGVPLLDSGQRGHHHHIKFVLPLIPLSVSGPEFLSLQAVSEKQMGKHRLRMALDSGPDTLGCHDMRTKLFARLI
jgi:hypothetical protein